MSIIYAGVALYVLVYTYAWFAFQQYMISSNSDTVGYTNDATSYGQADVQIAKSTMYTMYFSTVRFALDVVTLLVFLFIFVLIIAWGLLRNLFIYDSSVKDDTFDKTPIVMLFKWVWNHKNRVAHSASIFTLVGTTALVTMIAHISLLPPGPSDWSSFTGILRNHFIAICAPSHAIRGMRRFISMISLVLMAMVITLVAGNSTSIGSMFPDTWLKRFGVVVYSLADYYADLSSVGSWTTPTLGQMSNETPRVEI